MPLCHTLSRHIQSHKNIQTERESQREGERERESTNLQTQHAYTQFQREIVLFIVEGISLRQYMGSNGMKCTECVIGFDVFCCVYALHTDIFRITYCSLIRSTFWSLFSRCPLPWQMIVLCVQPELKQFMCVLRMCMFCMYFC